MDDTYLPRTEFVKETNRIHDELNKHDRQIAVLETLVENLRDLPDALNNLEKTMSLMGQNLEILNENVSSLIDKSTVIEERNRKQDEAIAKLDNKSKVDIMDFIKTNWWKICLGASGIILVIQQMIK